MELILTILAWWFGITVLGLAFVGFFAIMLFCDIVDELNKR